MSEPMQLDIAGEQGVWLPLTDANEIVGHLLRLSRQLQERYGITLKLTEGVVAFGLLVDTLAKCRESAEDGITAPPFKVAASVSARDLVTARQAADLIGCKERNVRALAARHRLIPVRRNPLMFDPVDVEDWTRQHPRKAG